MLLGGSTTFNEGHVVPHCIAAGNFGVKQLMLLFFLFELLNGTLIVILEAVDLLQQLPISTLKTIQLTFCVLLHTLSINSTGFLDIQIPFPLFKLLAESIQLKKNVFEIRQMERNVLLKTFEFSIQMPRSIEQLN